MNAKIFKSKNSESLWLDAEARRVLEAERVDVEIKHCNAEDATIEIRPGTFLALSNGYVSFARVHTMLSTLIGKNNLHFEVRDMFPVFEDTKLLIYMEVSFNGKISAGE